MPNDQPAFEEVIAIPVGPIDFFKTSQPIDYYRDKEFSSSKGVESDPQPEISGSEIF